MRERIELAKNRGHDLLAGLDARLERGEIDEAEWHRAVAAVIVPAYLAGDNPRAQSGQSGDPAHWERARRLVTDAIDRDGAFLDVGCASGHLMECVERWCAEDGRTVEAHGLDIAPELADLARRRLPAHAARIHVGNALEWEPPRRYDFVRTGLEYVPRRRRADLVARLLADVAAPGGRLIVGTYNEEREDRATERFLTEAGFPVAGRSERPHSDPRLAYRVLWIDAPR